MTTAMTFQKTLSRYRTALSVTQKDAAVRLQVPLKTLQNWEISRFIPREPFRTLLVGVMRQAMTEVTRANGDQGAPGRGRRKRLPASSTASRQ